MVIKTVRTRLSSYGIFLFGLLVISVFIYNILSEEMTYINIPLHSSIEAIGAFTAIGIAYLMKESTRALSFYSTSLKSGFLVMGILDLIHSIVGIGDSFVYANAMAVIAGGMGFFLTFLFNYQKRLLTDEAKDRAIIIIFSSILIIGIATVMMPEAFPKMLNQGIYTHSAHNLNLISGLLYLASFPYFFITYKRNKNKIISIYIYVLLLFGFSDITFEFSEIWSQLWWQWHLIRLIAYIFLIRIILITYENTRKSIVNYNKEILVINQKLENYSYTISHDLKEPIRSIRSFSSFILEDYNDLLDDEGKDYLDRVIRASSRMALMIDDLLILSSVGKKDTAFKNVSISVILDSVLNDIGVKVKEAQAEIIYDNLPVIDCQPLWMNVLFSNLILNSIKYCNMTAEHPCITISYKENDDFYTFYVQDNGKGIDEDQFKKIFGLFRRGTGDRNIEGSGAGLAIVQSIVQEHGGKVWVEESEINVGTTICFTIRKWRNQ